MKEADTLLKKKNPDILACPVCNAILIQNSKFYRCRNGHDFDIAKQGYVNLLQSRKKRTAATGDNKNMLVARRHFLERGFYEPVSNLLNKITGNYVSRFTKGSPIQIVDVGSGDGYYINRLRTSISNVHDVNLYGVEISKHASKMASKKYKDITFVVSNAVKLPFTNSSVDVLISLFSPFDETSAKKVLSKNGVIIQAVPLGNHLLELRQVLYDEVNVNSTQKNILTQEGYFKLEETQILNHKIHLSNQASIQEIFSMTPHYWRTNQNRKLKLSLLEQLDLTLEIEFRIYTCV